MLGCRLDIHAVQTQEVFAENFSLGLLSDLRIAALLNDVVRQLKLPEFGGEWFEGERGDMRLSNPRRLELWPEGYEQSAADRRRVRSGLRLRAGVTAKAAAATKSAGDELRYPLFQARGLLLPVCEVPVQAPI